MKALIIEDEPHARKEVIRLLHKINPEIEIVAELDSVTDACAYLESNKSFDVVFADIQLSDGLSFDIFSKHEIQQPVVFTTAYNEFAIKAFELNSIDYLLKPIEQSQLSKALDKLEKLKQNYSNTSLLLTADKLKELLSAKQEFKTRFVSKIGDQYKYTAVNDIAYFEADDNVVYAVTSSAKLLINYKMEELEQVLNPKQFFRINRGCIVQITAIQKVHKYFNSRLSIELMPKTQEPVLVSRLKVDEFLKWMDQ